MHQLRDMLMQYAIESGEIKVPQLMSDDDLLRYSLESAEREISQGFALVDTLEDLSDDVISRAAEQPEGELTEECMESYHRDIGNVLKVSGFQIPVTVVAPSFESAEASGDAKKSVKDKAKAVVDAVIKWIKERLKWLGELWQKVKAAIRNRGKKAEETAEKAKEDAAKAKEEGVEEVATPEAAPEEAKSEEKPAEGEKKEEAKPAKKSLKVIPAAVLPKWVVNNDRVNLDTLRGFVDGTIVKKDPKLAGVFTDLFEANAGASDHEMLGKIIEKSMELVKNRFPATPTTAHWRASVSELSTAIDILKGGIKSCEEGIDYFDKLRAEAQADLDKPSAAEKADGINNRRKDIQDSIANIQKGVKVNLESQKMMNHLLDLFAKALSHTAGGASKAA